MCLREEALRLMGMRGRAPDEMIRAALKFALSRSGEIPFRSLTRPCAFSMDGQTLLLDGHPVPGRDLAQSVGGCREGVLIGATLGAQADALLRRWQLRGALDGAAMQAVLSARLEMALDGLCRTLESARPDFFLTSRFSPGYGDLPLSFQPFLMERLQMARLGVFLTGGLMMAPSKSVSAIAGWTRGAPARAPRKCALCSNADCPYRSYEENRP